MIWLKKCEHCHNWTNGNKAFCEKCGEILDLDYLKQAHHREVNLKQNGFLFKWFKFKNQNNVILLLLEKIIQGGQAIVFAILALVTFILLWLPG